MWIYHGRPVEDEDLVGHVGFVYCIHRVDTGRMYIGKKKFTRKVTKKPLKGKTRKRVTYADNGWRDYWGSNDELLKEIEELGPDLFRKEILVFCKTLAECSYFELREQMDRRVLESDQYYNSWIFVKIRKSHLKKIGTS